jgi:hypothetical protein
MIKNVPQVISLGLKTKLFFMNKRKFVPQKKTQEVIAKKQSASIHKPTREEAPCGASIKQGRLFAHESTCPQCKLAKADHKAA